MQPTATRPARLPQIDVLRLLICASVVALHVTGNANPVTSVGSNAVVNLLHYTRQGFFFISALVLVYTHRDGKGATRRRIAVLGVPYLVWCTIYAVIGLFLAFSWWSVRRLPWTWFVGLIQGTDGYHMYFLLVSVQFAIVFPLFVRLLRATQGHHGTLLLVSGLVEVGLMAFYHYGYLPNGWWRSIAGESSLTAYQFWVVAGGVAALHVDTFHAWMTRHRMLVWSAFGAVCAAATATYFVNMRAHHEAPEYAALSLQPITVPLSVAAIGAFYLLSVRIAAIGQPLARRAIDLGTYLAFGIYLCHPALLYPLLLIEHHLPVAVRHQAALLTVLIFLVDFTLAVSVAALLSRTRWSRALVGRPQRRAGRAAGATRAAEPAPAPGGEGAEPAPAAAQG